MLIKSGRDLEDAIFGRHSSGDLFERFGMMKKSFKKDISLLISKSYDIHPNTQIGESLYWLVKKELERFKVETQGFAFLGAINSFSDLRHLVDGLFYLPSVYRFPVTVDAYNIDPRTLDILKDLWIDGFEGDKYGVGDFQSDLFRYKNGMAKWKRDNQTLETEEIMLVKPIDFRYYTRTSRPANHFLITPRDVGDRAGKRAFARMVARYFASKVA